MLFGSGFDESLWLIVKNDKKNRKKILDFIRELPSEFILKIQETLIEYNKYKLDNEGILISNKNYRSFTGVDYLNNDDLYSFSIDLKKDCLFITRSVCRYARQFSDFSIFLSNYNNEVNSYEIQEIGKVFYDFRENVESLNDVGFEIGTNIEYSLFKGKFINVVFSSDNNGIIRVCGLDNDNIPDYNIDNIETTLVRRRILRKEKNDI